jgi:hypothetical protein
MTQEQNDILFDLLTKKAVYGLDEAEQNQLDDLDPGTADAEFRSLEITAAAISMVGFSDDEPLPPHLASKIAANATKIVGSVQAATDSPWPPTYVTDEKPARSWFGWFGWVAAVAACIALAVNIYMTRLQPPLEVNVFPPIEIPKVLTMAEMREAMLRSTAGVIKANWAAGNVKELKDISGDIVWSDEKQAGYMRFRGLPVNDVTKETYQLWIFDKTQDKATPIDGGTFDVTANGEVVIPINAKLKAQEPGMFAITVEKPGGVVVSKREKIAALATVETKTG